jgi:hypothetical protein
MRRSKAPLYAGITALIMLVALSGAVPAVQAASVANTNDNGPGSLRQAIADAAPGETINVGVKGVITLTSGELVVGKDLTINGPGANGLNISGGKSSRVFNITGGTVTLTGLTVRDGKTTGSPARGGGIYNSGTLTLRSVTVTSNRAEGTESQCAYGGGVYNNATLTVANAVISGNIAQGGAGPTGGNSARGGGICTVGPMTVSGSVVTGNTAAGGDSSGPGRAGDGEGGGIFCYNNCVVSVEAATISGNTARAGNASAKDGIGGYASGGGVIQNWGGGAGTRTYVNCTISGNTTQGGTGGMADSCTRGGGIWETSSATFVNCTVAQNRAAGRFQEGGGLYSAAAPGEGPVIKNCVFVQNAAASGPDLRGHVRSQDFNLIGSANGHTPTGATGQNIVGQDAKLGPLADNGGLTQTHALLAGSPAIDRSPADACPVPTDERGVHRPQGANCDVGAYELDTVPPNAKTVKALTASPTNSKTVSFSVGFDEDIRNFNAENDLAIAKTGAVAYAGASITGGPQDYTVVFNGVKGDGTLAIAVSTKSAVQDMAANALASSATSSPVTIDNTPPNAVAIAPVTPSPTNGDKAAFLAEFSENVRNFDAEGDLVITQTGTAARSGVAITGGPQKYTVEIAGMTGDGAVTLAVNLKSDVRDIAGNALAAGVTSAPLTIDHTPPTVTLGSTLSSPTNADAIPFTAVFSEAVASTFTPEQAALTGTLASAASAQIGGTDPSYTVAVTPADPNANGTIGIVAGQGVKDLAGNPLAAATASPIITVDNAPPTVTVTAVTPSPTNADSVVFNAVFSEPVAPTFTPESVALTGTLASAASAQIGGTDPSYTVAVTPADPNANGTIGIVAGAHAKDLAGNALPGPVASPVLTIDNTAPTVTIKAATPSPTNADAITFNVAFSEAIAPTFTPDQVGVTGTLAEGALVQIGGADPSYTVTLTPKDPNANGTLGINIRAGVKDPAGNALAAPVDGPLVTIDNTAPTAKLDPGAPGPAGSGAVNFVVVFSEAVAPTFAMEHVTLTGTLASSASAQMSGTDPSYIVTVTPKDPNSTGTVGIIVGKGVADPAGNPYVGGSSPLFTKAASSVP